MRGTTFLPNASLRKKIETLLLFSFFLSASLVASDPHSAIINEGDVETFCLDQLALGTNKPSYILNLCPESGGESVEFTLDDETWCVTYEGTATPGIDTACVVLCSNNFVCDTTIFYITTLPTPQTQLDTLVIFETKSVCSFTFANLDGKYDAITNSCSGNTPQNVNFVIEPDLCITITGENLGVGRACLDASNSTSTDFSYFDVYVRMPEPEFLNVEVFLDETVTLCAEDLELFGGNFTNTSICGTSTLFDSEYSLNRNCFDITGLDLGSDVICTVVCDDNNVCDTIEVEVNVLERITLAAPTGENDEFDVEAGVAENLAVCANDDIPTEEEATLAIVGIPNFGTAFVSEDACEIIYEALPNACDQIDSLEYELCNSAGCGRAMMYMNIICDTPEEKLAVVGGFSPNGDDKNETLVVTGLDRYPDHTLSVFNRYGAKLLETKEYQGDWDGRWDGKEIPDGVYYYLLDTGEGEQASGWFVIQR